jgi:hypothetical protein
MFRFEMGEDRLRSTYPDLPWKPKQAFFALAAAYNNSEQGE